MTGPRVAVIGLGQIGLEVARRLAEADLPVSGYRRNDGPDIAVFGAVRAESVAAAVAGADIVLQCLPDVAALDDVAAQALSVCREGQVFVEFSSYPFADKVRYRDALAMRGVPLVEVEISGTPDMVRDGTAAFFAGFDGGLPPPAVHVLDLLSERVIPVGGFGAALSMKLVANLMVASHVATAAEALALGEALGLDADRMIEVIGRSPAASEMFRIRGPRMVRAAWRPAPGPVSTLEKYLDWIASAGMSHALDLPVFAASTALYRQAAAHGDGDADIAVVRRQVGIRGIDP